MGAGLIGTQFQPIGVIHLISVNLQQQLTTTFCFSYYGFSHWVRKNFRRASRGIIFLRGTELFGFPRGEVRTETVT